MVTTAVPETDTYNNSIINKPRSVRSVQKCSEMFRNKSRFVFKKVRRQRRDQNEENIALLDSFEGRKE
jgi:hypothetical protein